MNLNLRPTQASIFSQVRTGIRGNTARLIAAQLEVSSGRRIQRPSDDAAGTSIALTLRRQIGALESFVDLLPVVLARRQVPTHDSAPAA